MGFPVPIAVTSYPFSFVAIAAVAGRYDGVKLHADSTENITIPRPSPTTTFAAASDILAPSLAAALPLLQRDILITHHLIIVNLFTQRSLPCLYHRLVVIGG